MNYLITAQHDNVLVADFVDTTILDQSKVDSVGRELQELVDQPAVIGIVVDMHRVEFLSSAMIGEFIKLSDRCNEKGLKLKLCNLSVALRDILKITNLDQIFDSYPNREDALQSFP